MRVKHWLVISAALLELSCGSLPPAPEGELGVHDAASGMVKLADLKTGSALPSVAFSTTDSWIMFSPETWENVSNYIDELIRRLEAKGFRDHDSLVVSFEGSGQVLSVKLSELKEFRAHLRKVKKSAS